ncbi:MAG TPA: hypothetical protein VH370_12270 [Humisphaera sp.]|jgi:hypothetical protein|nr:hypothetical protein [Humisphaera sp.]
MNSEFVIRIIEERPFVPYRVYLADGRTRRVRHPEMVELERYGAAIRIFDDKGRKELIDSGMIVSFKSMRASS